MPSCSSQLLYEHIHRYAVAAALARDKRVLDIACGEGYGSNILATTAAYVLGVDIAAEVITHARGTYRKDNLSFRVGSCLDIPAEDHSIDLIVSFETIEHIDDHVSFLREIKRVLAPDGALIISSPDKAEYSDRAGTRNPFHKRELYHEEFHLLIQQHFKHSRIGKQKLVAGSWIAPDTASPDDIFGTFSGDIHYVAFQRGVHDGLYSLALCSDAPLPPFELGVYANPRESENIWNLLDRFGSAERIQNEIASVERMAAECAHKAELLELAGQRDRANQRLMAQLELQLRQLRDQSARATRDLRDQSARLELQLRQLREQSARATRDLREQLTRATRQAHNTLVKLAQKETRSDELLAELRRQFQTTKKLIWFLQETAKAATRLRSSRRWKIGNPFDALREILGGRKVAGYGHLDKVIADYSKWRSTHPETEDIDARVQALTSERATSVACPSTTNGTAAPLSTPPVPTRPIRFATHETVEVSIIIPVFNQLRFTEACLASIQEHQGEHSSEVIVVDDCSSDGTLETLRSIPGLVYLRNEKNLGFIASCNFGASHARGKYLVFLNNDTLLTPRWLPSLLETFEFEPNAGIVGSKLLYPDGRLQEAGGIIWQDGSGWNRGKFDDPRKPEYNFLCEVDYCSAACLILTKSLFQGVGGFDGRYVPAYYEDTDLAFKVREAGFKVLYQPLSEVIHFEGVTSGTDLSAGAKRYQDINRNTFVQDWAEVLARKPRNGDVAALEKLGDKRKRILVIDHHLPMPDRDSGSLRMSQILTILYRLGHRVTFLPDNLSDIPPYGDELRKRGIEVIVRPHITTAIKYLESDGAKYDAVILSRCGTAQPNIKHARLYASRSRIIFDTVDLHFLRTAREAELKRDVNCAIRARETQQQEYQMIDQADETWVVSEIEREMVLRDLPGRRIEVVSNIVEIREPTTSFADRTDFLFIGSFLHPPNVDAVLFFVHEIHPLIAQRLGSAKFYIIGNKPPAEVVALADENIVVTGAVPDVRPFFDSVKLSVAPLRFGAGVKGKINQSMGLGVPVVATSIAAEGMSLNYGEDVLVADEPAAFAESVVNLYQSEDTWNRLSKNGLATTRLYYSAEVAQRQLSRLFHEEHTSGSAHLDPISVAG